MRKRRLPPCAAGSYDGKGGTPVPRPLIEAGVSWRKLINQITKSLGLALRCIGYDWMMQENEFFVLVPVLGGVPWAWSLGDDPARYADRAAKNAAKETALRNGPDGFTPSLAEWMRRDLAVIAEIVRSKEEQKYINEDGKLLALYKTYEGLVREVGEDVL